MAERRIWIVAGPDGAGKTTFARALRLGLGRARIDVRRHGIAGREDLLVAACLRNPTRDPQLEGSLAWWLFAIWKDAGRPDAVRRAVLARAVRPIPGRHDADQVADLVALFVGEGDAAARRALLRMVEVQPARTDSGAEQAIWALGEPGWRHVVRSFGRRWDEAREADWDWLVYRAGDEIGVRRAVAIADEEAAKDPRLRPLAVRVAAEVRDRRRSRRDPPADGSLGALERYVASRRRTGFSGSTWARAATAADRREAWRRLVVERHPRRLLRRLRAWWLPFGVARPPFAPRLLAHLSHADRRVRRAAAYVLAEFRDPRLRTFALRRLREDARRAIDDGVVGLLERNARRADADVLLRAVPPRASRETLHRWALDARLVATPLSSRTPPRRGPAWDAVLLRVREIAPCRACREFALSDLVERRAAPDALLREALLDAQDETRALARKALAARRTARGRATPVARTATGVAKPAPRAVARATRVRRPT